MDKLKLVPLTVSNVKIAGQIQYKVFPNSASYYLYKQEVKGNKPDYNDFIIYVNCDPVGIIGYNLDNADKNTVWLSWFGLLENYRSKGYGKKSLDMLIEMLKEKGFETLRLFTYEVWNKTAQPFYNKYMDFGEYYTNKEDNQFDIVEGKCKIFTKSLSNKKAKLWNNVFIDIGAEDSLHVKSLKELKKDNLIG